MRASTVHVEKQLMQRASPVRACVCVCEAASHVRVVSTPKGYFFVVVSGLPRVEGIPFHPTKPY
jgi:hypothetical protein